MKIFLELIIHLHLHWFCGRAAGGRGAGGGQHGDLVHGGGRGQPGGRRGAGGGPGLAVVVGGLVLLQLPLVPVAAVAHAAHERLLSRVDPRVGDEPLPPQESFATSLTLVGQIPRVSSGMSVEFTSVTETFLAQATLKWPFA